VIRVHVICEGQTEETFVNEVLYDCLFPKGIHLIPSLVGKPGHKGGDLRRDRLLTDVRTRLFKETHAYCTTFFDFYGLPADFPGKVAASGQRDCRNRAEVLQNALYEDFKQQLGEDVVRRFIPYVQMHEFEGLLFSDTAAFAQGIGQNSLAGRLRSIRDSFASPEDINDSPLNAPSKRITQLFPGYEKPLYGSLCAVEIGLDAIRRECSHFDAWIGRLEALTHGIEDSL
jgi:hypothetical protein